MIRSSADLSPAVRDRFDQIIDVRSPGEFAQDHVPGAINLPVLDDAERAEVGTLYVQVSRFQARRVGAAKVARNIARHLETALADRPAGFRPLVYCWRGGMRSNAMATVLSQVGWPAVVVEGGYRSWRRLVVASLHAEAPLGLSLRLLDGPTGVGKTELLAELAAAGAQVVDLETLAGHRGSLFGATPGGQPEQKLFESRLMDALQRLDPARPVYAEAESARIGEIALPAALWAAMREAPRIGLEAPVPARVAFILKHYADIAADRQALADLIRRLPTHHSRADRENWLKLCEGADLAPLVLALIEAHYDPAYARARARSAAPLLARAPVPAGPGAAAAVIALGGL